MTRVVSSLLSCLALLGLLAGCAAPTGSGHASGPQGQIDGPARLKMADAAADAGNSQLATTLYTRALTDPALPTEGRIRAAEMLMALGQPAAAEAALTNRLSKGGSLSAEDETNLRRALARLHIVAGQPARAMAECDALLARHPDDMAALVDKGVALDLLGRHAEAQAIYHRALARTPDDATVLSDLALSQALQGRIADAQATAAPLQARTDLPDRIKTDLGLLAAAGNDPAHAAPLLDGRTPGDADVVALTDAMRARSTGDGH